MNDLALESASTVAISKALAAAQKEITPPRKAHTAKITDTRSYSYADLAAIIECVKEPFAKNGLSHSEAMLPHEGHILLVTTIRHESGEWVRSFYPIATYQKPQETGSAITYGRRYSLGALAGIAAEDDDDGAAAQGGTPKAAPKSEPKPAEVPTVKASVLSREEIEAMHALAKAKGINTVTAFREYLKGLTQQEQAKDLSKAEYVSVMDALKAMREKVPA